MKMMASSFSSFSAATELFGSIHEGKYDGKKKLSTVPCQCHAIRIPKPAAITNYHASPPGLTRRSNIQGKDPFRSIPAAGNGWKMKFLTVQCQTINNPTPAAITNYNGSPPELKRSEIKGRDPLLIGATFSALITDIVPNEGIWVEFGDSNRGLIDMSLISDSYVSNSALKKTFKRGMTVPVAVLKETIGYNISRLCLTSGVYGDACVTPYELAPCGYQNVLKPYTYNCTLEDDLKKQKQEFLRQLEDNKPVDKVLLECYARKSINTMRYLLKKIPEKEWTHIVIQTDASYYLSGFAGVAITFVHKLSGVVLGVMVASYSSVTSSEESEGIAIRLGVMLRDILDLKGPVQNDCKGQVARATKYFNKDVELISRDYNRADIYAKWSFQHPPRVIQVSSDQTTSRKIQRYMAMIGLQAKKNKQDVIDFQQFI